jgi:hypothetical protein
LYLLWFPSDILSNFLKGRRDKDIFNELCLMRISS